MRKLFLVFFLVGFLGVSLPLTAQHRKDAPIQNAPVKLYGDNASGFVLNKLFDPQHFRMGHSYALSFGSFGGQGQSMGLYTNTMNWQFNDKLAARVDIGFMHNPFGSGALKQEFGGQQQSGQVFLQNAEFAYRPSENFTLHFSMRQSPYGSYMSPYGYGHGYHQPYGYGFGYGNRMDSFYGHRSGADLFWRRDTR